MIYRALLFAYIWTCGTVLWLAWALVQTAARGNARMAVIGPDDPAHEGYSYRNCFTWALWKWLSHGGTLQLTGSPRIPVWRTEWTPPGSHDRWHFEPRHPKRGIAGIWHSFIHEGRPRRSNADV